MADRKEPTRISNPGLSDGFVYVAASKKRHFYIRRASILGGTTTHTVYDARLFFTKAEARSWCEGRAGWHPVKIAALTPEYQGAVINSRFRRP